MSEPKEVKLVARRKIQGPEWDFRRGAILVGYREAGGTWAVWPPGRYDGVLHCVPRWYVRRLRPGKMSRAGRPRKAGGTK
jgi:hypothetical protein